MPFETFLGRSRSQGSNKGQNGGWVREGGGGG